MKKLSERSFIKRVGQYVLQNARFWVIDLGLILKSSYYCAKINKMEGYAKMIRNKVDELKKRYYELFEDKENIDWATRRYDENNCETEDIISPSIPFIGNNYPSDGGGFLIYGSAENHSWHKRYDKYLDRNDVAIDRYRKRYDDDTKDKFYPIIGIQPLTNGGLTLAAFYIYRELTGDKSAITPRDFYEKIACANYGKFTIKPEDPKNPKNTDYANDEKTLQFSLEYVKADLEILKPKYVIMPKTIYDNVEEDLKCFLQGVTVIPIYQINAQTINRLIKKNYPKKEIEGKVINEWYNELSAITGKTKENYKCVFTYLDEAIEKVKKNVADNASEYR